MAKAKSNSHGRNNEDSSSRNPEEDVGLLAEEAGSEDEDEDKDIIVHSGAGQGQDEHQAHTPRTPNRVRFDLPALENGGLNTNHGRAPPVYDDDEDEEPRVHPSFRNQPFTPLLTGIEAPSVTVASGPWHNDEDVHTWAERERSRPKSNLRNAFMNMANSIIGAGIIGQPYAFRQAGLLTGVILLVALTITVDWTIRLIVINSKLSGRDSFQGTVEFCFGRTGLIAISVAQWAFAFGGMIAFCIIVGDSIPHVLTAVFPGLRDVPVLGLLANRRAVIMIFVLGISYPLSLYRDIAKLAKASTLALISMMIILFTVVTQGFMVPKEDRGELTTPLLTINDGVFQAIGVISFAFVCHHNSLLIYGSLKTPTIDRFSTVTHYSTSISMLACLLMALSGFLTFGSQTLGNVLNNFPTANPLVNLARLCFGLNMLTTLPLEAFVCREVMLNYWFPHEPFNMHLHLIFTSALVVSAMALSLITCDLGAVFELIGATSACALAYILPPLCYIKLTQRTWRSWMAATCVAFGAAVMLISLFQASTKMIRNEGGVTQCHW
ncbi:hypothetical protein MFRU_015g01470 [Monilinia fructicola]|nr:hypothetical protein MFRU_015g01470 [Monilinia fructicola]